ncbi:MAG: hypothetical protein R3Y12_00755 [Clostridia bacterium]
MNFAVYYKKRACGFVSTTNDDIFTTFIANCDIISLEICRLYLKKDDKEILLGVLIPKNGRYVLNKKFALSYINKISLDESFYAYIKCENDDLFKSSIIKETISDKNLANCICESILKESFENYDLYSFKYLQNSPFLFDFCFTLCKFSNNYVYIKTDKRGKIIV